MKKQQFFFLILSFILMVVTSCENEKNVQSKIDALRVEESSLRKEVYQLDLQKDSKTAENAELDKQCKLLKIYASGKQPKFILKLKLEQSHFMDLGASIKDAMNAITFEMPVDKEFYDNVQIKTKIIDEFRTGSLLINGSFGDWEMTVVGKEIRE